MTLILRTLFAALLSLAITLPVGAEQNPRVYTQAELDQMLAPVALYPDPLLSQLLMAATYPLEVAEAARWSRANPGLQGDDAVRAAQNEDWDPSVKSLLAFPQLLQRLDDSMDWTRALGDAFLAQEPQVMDTVQQLRRRAQAAGNLQSNDQLYVQQQGPAILIQPVRPGYLYVPYYDPWVVYGAWWWPAYRPVYWAPWPRPYGVRISVGFFFGSFDWQRRNVRVVNVNNYYYRPPVAVNRTVIVEANRWQHDPSHRRGVAYRVPEVRQRYAGFQPRNDNDVRRDERRHPEERHQVLSRPPEAQAQPQRVQPQQAQPQQAQPQQAREQPRERARERERAQPQVRAQPQERAQPRAREQPAPQARQEARPRMPEAAAPQQPRADRNERAEQRRERIEQRREQRKDRNERDQKG